MGLRVCRGRRHSSRPGHGLAKKSRIFTRSVSDRALRQPTGCPSAVVHYCLWRRRARKSGSGLFAGGFSFRLQRIRRGKVDGLAADQRDPILRRDRERSLLKSHTAEHHAVHHCGSTTRYRPRLGGNYRRRVLCRVRRYRLRHHASRRHLPATGHVRRHHHPVSDRRRADGAHAQTGTHGRAVARERRGALMKPRKFLAEHESLILGTGFIVLLLVIWESVPLWYTLPRGMALFFTTPSRIAAAFYELLLNGEIEKHFYVSAVAF